LKPLLCFFIEICIQSETGVADNNVGTTKKFASGWLMQKKC